MHCKGKLSTVHTPMIRRLTVHAWKAALKAMEEFGVSVILEKRLRLSSVHEDPPRRNAAGHRMVRTEDGCEIATDLIVSQTL